MRVLTAFVIAGAAIALSGCDSGEPTAAPTKPRPTPSPPAGELDVCQILDTAMRGSGYPAGQKAPTDPDCSTGTKTGSVGFDLHLLKPGEENFAVEGNHSSRNITIGGRPSTASPGPEGCTITVPLAKDVTKVKYGSALITYKRIPTTSDSEMCRHAKQLATKIETQLPPLK